MKHWTPPDDWMKITTIDAHTEGEPFRVITGGFPEIEGDTLLEYRRFTQKTYDNLRTCLMWEPRGHADMYGCLVTPPVSPEADFGVLFMHNEGFSTMCGHGIIGIATIALETGMIPMNPPVTVIKIDSPAGLVTASARTDGKRVQSVSFQNVPSFVVELDATVYVPGIGEISYDLAFGGAFYALVEAGTVALSTTPDHFSALVDKGMQIKRAIMANREIDHPFEDDLGFLYGTIFVGPPRQPGAHSSNVCVFAEGEVDRSPTGTGVSARLAVHYARSEIRLDQSITIESIIGTHFKGKVVTETTFGSYPAIIPEVEGSAYITGRHEFLIDPRDPLRDGFVLR
jgi:trans-L-3-hydroxyproline dehydratase